MAYIVGLVTPEEEEELERRGWVIESPPTELRTEGEGDGMRTIMVFVDSNLFTIMDGPDWDKVPAKENT